MNGRRIAAHYSAVTPQYREYSGDARGWHWGIWEPDIRTHQQSLVRSHEVLVRGLDLSPGSHVLDVGCGVGGFAVWAARTFGVRVTGITICADHVPLARRHARESGIGRLCEFLAMDMDRLRLDARFDLVVNQESFCYSLDKRRYLSSVFEVLAPGGAWRCIDTCNVKGRSSAESRRLRSAVYDGFRIPSFASIEAVERHLATAGFVEVQTIDLTSRVLPNGRRMEVRACALASLFPRWCFPGTRAACGHRGGIYRAGAAVMAGFRRGYFKHVLHQARRPARGPTGRGTEGDERGRGGTPRPRR